MSDRTQALHWIVERPSLRELCARLCFGDSFDVTPQDREKAGRVLSGQVYFRKHWVLIEDWKKPSAVVPGLLNSWLFYYHSLVWLDPLRRQYSVTGQTSLRDRLELHLLEWLRLHGAVPDVIPTNQKPGDYTWYDMSTAWRTLTIVAALSVGCDERALMPHLMTHAVMLVNEDFYAKVGNHALHQNDALLTAGLVLDRSDYVDIALERIDQLRRISVDEEGVSLEGSPAYHVFNMFWWRNTRRRTEIVNSMISGVRLPSIPDMRDFLKYAVAPDGKFCVIGDTTMSNSPVFNVTAERYNAEFIEYLKADEELKFVLTQGAEGTPLSRDARAFSDGYWFSRGVFATRPPRLDSHVSVRFGAGMGKRVHAHDDAGSITFYAEGERIIEDGGLFGYYGGENREFVKSAAAHNVILVDGRKYYRSAVSVLEKTTLDPVIDQAVIRITAIEKTKWSRFVAHVKPLRLVFVQDVVETDGASAQQQFNLGDGFDIKNVLEGRVDAESQKHRLSLIWLTRPGGVTVTTGSRKPMVGWRSTFEGEIHPVPSARARVADATLGASKLAVVIVLLRKEEAFDDVCVKHVGLGTRSAKFLLAREGGATLLNLRLDGPSHIEIA